MKLLLDTHTFLWLDGSPEQLSPTALAACEDPANQLYLSVVSAWEIVIKCQARKLRLPESPSVYIPTRSAHYGIETLPVILAHVLASESLPTHHRDPFDRLLIAQAKVEDVPILTADPQIRGYPVKVLW